MGLWKSTLSLILIHRQSLTSHNRFSRFSTKMAKDASILAQAWREPIISLEATLSCEPLAVQKAIQRTIPLLEDTASVPFVCRYRVDIIQPLSTLQVQHLHELLEKHSSLESLRNKLLGVIQDDDAVRQTIMTTTSKAVLEDMYAPFKPPPKGSILERIQEEHPELIREVDAAWESGSKLHYAKSLEDKVIHVMASKIAALPSVVEQALDQLRLHCRIQTTSETIDNYNEFGCLLRTIRNHQVLAIERGVSDKSIQMSFDIDASKMESCVRYHLLKQVPTLHKLPKPLLEASIHNAWTRLLRRRLTSRLWKEKLSEATRRAIVVFQQNLRRALLAPPLQPPRPVLALDPGFQAGIKCAILDINGDVLQLDTIQFLGNKEQLALKKLKDLMAAVPANEENNNMIVALGNGHGSQEARALLGQLKTENIHVELVNEAGASVWSVTPSAKLEFPSEPASAVAAVSIGRRLQNPLAELVKVPPRSLGLGMYQHDMNEKELDEKLHVVSVDAVATVGVDCNSCSLEILQKVPGLAKLAEKVIQRRPLQERRDLLDVPGLGPKTYENCAAFCRVRGSDPLDDTCVHPESYDLARWLLQELGWNIEKIPRNIASRGEWTTVYKTTLDKAAAKFGVSVDRVVSVLQNLVDSMMHDDPRLNELQGVSEKNVVGKAFGCARLSPDLASDEKALAQACPVRSIIGSVRNIADFGAFVDFGGHNDGLVHTSRLGPMRLDNLLIGQEIGVDILSVKSNRVELAFTGLNMVSNTSGGSGSDGRVRGDTQRNHPGSQQARNLSTLSKSKGNDRVKKRPPSTSKQSLTAAKTSSSKRQKTDSKK